MKESLCKKVIVILNLPVTSISLPTLGKVLALVKALCLIPMDFILYVLKKLTKILTCCHKYNLETLKSLSVKQQWPVHDITLFGRLSFSYIDNIDNICNIDNTIKFAKNSHLGKLRFFVWSHTKAYREVIC